MLQPLDDCRSRRIISCNCLVWRFDDCLWLVCVCVCMWFGLPVRNYYIIKSYLVSIHWLSINSLSRRATFDVSRSTSKLQVTKTIVFYPHSIASQKWQSTDGLIMWQEKNLCRRFVGRRDERRMTARCRCRRSCQSAHCSQISWLVLLLLLLFQFIHVFCLAASFCFPSASCALSLSVSVSLAVS